MCIRDRAAAAIVVLGGYAATLRADFVQGIVMLAGVIALIAAVIRCDQAVSYTHLDVYKRQI